MVWVRPCVFVFIVAILTSGCIDDRPVEVQTEIEATGPLLEVPETPSRYSIGVNASLDMTLLESPRPFRVSIYGGLPELTVGRDGSLGLLIVREGTESLSGCSPLDPSTFSFFRKLPGDETTIYREGDGKFEPGLYRMYVFSDTLSEVVIGFNGKDFNNSPEKTWWNETEPAGRLHVLDPEWETYGTPLPDRGVASQLLSGDGRSIVFSALSFEEEDVSIDREITTEYSGTDGEECSSAVSTVTTCPSIEPGCRPTMLNNILLNETQDHTWEAKIDSHLTFGGSPKIRLMLLALDEKPGSIEDEAEPRHPIVDVSSLSSWAHDRPDRSDIVQELFHLDRTSLIPYG